MAIKNRGKLQESLKYALNLGSDKHLPAQTLLLLIIYLAEYGVDEFVTKELLHQYDRGLYGMEFVGRHLSEEHL